MMSRRVLIGCDMKRPGQGLWPKPLFLLVHGDAFDKIISTL